MPLFVHFPVVLHVSLVFDKAISVAYLQIESVSWCYFHAMIAFIGVAFTVYILQWMRQRKRK
jgi:hypothetical protein